MRFSDMMGSGDDKSSKRPSTESEALIADALAPYLGAELADVAKVAEVVPEVADVPVTPVRPFGSVAPVIPIAPRDPIAATIADFAPISDDLLPRRR
jgi:hypothetical protein